VATITIVNLENKETIHLQTYVAEYVLNNKMFDYTYYNTYVSHNTRATWEDLFCVNADIIAVKVVAGGIGGIVTEFASMATLGLTRKIWNTVSGALKKPKMPTISTGTNAAVSPANTMGGRSNEVRLGGRIEDIWGTHPKVIPSLLSSYNRFNSDKIEVECSILCVGEGKYGIGNVVDGDYSVTNIPTTCVDFYEDGASIGGTPSYSATTNSCVFTPMSVLQNTAISSQELNAPNTGGVTFGAAVYINMTTRGTFVSASNTATIVVSSTSVADWTATSVQIGSNIGFGNITYAVDEQALYYSDCATISGTVTNVSVGSITVDIVWATINGISKTWDQWPLNINTASALTRWNRIYYPIYDGENNLIGEVSKYYMLNSPNPPYNAPQLPYLYGESQEALTNGSAFISVTSEYQATPVFIEWDSNTPVNGDTTKYLLNYVCEGGTAGGANTAVITTHYSNATTSTTEYVYPVDLNTAKRVGYSEEITFTYGTIYPVKFTVHRKLSTTDSFVLRDVYRFIPIPNYSDSGVTLIRLERSFNNAYGAASDLSLSMQATRKIYPVVESGDTWSLGPTLGLYDKFDTVIANLHVDKFNGRRTPISLDFQTLKQARLDVENRVGADHSKIGVVFDNASVKYDEEVNTILEDMDCNSFQVGSKLYTNYEQPDDIAMQFTHRDVVPESLKLTRVFRKTDANDGVKLTYVLDNQGHSDNGTTKTIYMPSSTTINNPLEVELLATHTLAQAQVRLMREYNKLLYQKSGCSFTATALGRLAVPNMVVSVVDTTKEAKTDGEILSTFIDVDTKLVAELSQDIASDVSTIILTDEEGNVSTWPCTYFDIGMVKFSTTPSIDIYTGWAQDKTRYQVTSGSTYKKYIITEIEVKSFNEVDITCINYDERYYEGDIA